LTVLGMQVLVEGLALAAFAAAINRRTRRFHRYAFIMEDEARHVAFGRRILEEHYPRLTERERDEREELVVEASYLLRDRFQGDEVWAALGLPLDACRAHVRDSGFLRTYRAQLFSRIVPVIRAIGLWGPRVRRAYGSMGVLGFAGVDLDALTARDERAAADIDARRAHRGAPQGG
jgi:hypothetical protein